MLRQLFLRTIGKRNPISADMTPLMGYSSQAMAGTTRLMSTGTQRIALSLHRNSLLARGFATDAHLDTKSKKTTGWTEKTKNFFHPGCIITALRLDYSGYSPNNLVGITELACHILEGNRAACQPYISHKGAIMGFAFDVIPRVKMIQGELRKMFPELAEFADSLGKRDLKKIFRSSKSIDDLQAEIETKFGKTVEVSFRYCDEVQVKNEILNQQVSQLNLWVKKGVSVGVIVPEEKVAPEFNPTPTPGMGKKL